MFAQVRILEEKFTTILGLVPGGEELSDEGILSLFFIHKH